MMNIYEIIISSIKIIIPIYIANAVPVLFKGKRPIDFGRSFIDGKRLFGDGKTFEGFISGVFFGTVAGAIVYSTLYGFILSLGALLGDLFGAFIKRRLGLPRGHPFPILDQLDFVFGALLLFSLFHPIIFEQALFIILITPPIHIISNAIAYLFRLKPNPW
ncbi:MAG: CDP-2,3-bis-(O-geranylgeranyl)-sn-glycerol synthase [Candidatus Methanomethyliaceae archaeon]|nr:CDP-2,3-bis-(O-geranylgeranyl)-sn-glycerol synthase [Candidatus Methanomethyliaceae archaeon]MDW7970495.1 CDP-2,3-bis-(O-geranylgeranyl)-sn-glycerol synthase [Nitrososphaerota archaeon]